MASIKRYEVRGAMEYSLPIKFGQRYIRVTFTGGCVNSQRTEPASVLVGSPLIQSLIEESKEYKRGIIKLASIIETEEKSAEEGDVYDDITTVQQARTLLVGKYKQDIAFVQNKKQVLGVAERLGVKFPNIK